MIIVTGASGFIGSCLVQRLNEQGFTKNVFVVDDFYKDYKDRNLDNKFIRDWIHRDLFLEWFTKVANYVEFIFHLGARTDTTEKDTAIFKRLNLDYSKSIWNICAEYNIPLVYASSAATYGDGNQGFKDDESALESLKPLNPYGESKHDFDIWALAQSSKPDFFTGLKFFNVYGPNEYHKGRMASVIFHATQQIRATSKMRLFRSHRPDYKDGDQRRDFIYVNDLLDICMFMMKERPANGIYNVGTGQARSFLDLTNQIFRSLKLKPNIEFIDIPEDIRDTYQYFTEAEMGKLIGEGYSKPFTSIDSGVDDYITKFLAKGIYY